MNEWEREIPRKSFVESVKWMGMKTSQNEIVSAIKISETICIEEVIHGAQCRWIVPERVENHQNLPHARTHMLASSLEPVHNFNVKNHSTAQQQQQQKLEILQLPGRTWQTYYKTYFIKIECLRFDKSFVSYAQTIRINENKRFLLPPRLFPLSSYFFISAVHSIFMLVLRPSIMLTWLLYANAKERH